MRKLVAALAAVAWACGGGDGSASQQSEESMAAPAGSELQAQPAPAGTVHEVEMLLTDDGNYIYRPDALTIKVGDTVRWVNVSDLHNVSFYGDQIPTNGQEFLEKAMPPAGKLGPLAGPLLTQAGATYEISFEGAPVGDYAYFCTPHEALGMKATLTVEE